MAAALEIFQDKIIKTRIEIAKNINSTRATPVKCWLKNINDHKTFKARLMAKTMKNALRFPSFFLLLFQIKNKLMPMSTKSVVQTGAKIQFGGLNEGLLSVAYQVAILGVVNKVPMLPTTRTITMEIMNLRALSIFLG